MFDLFEEYEFFDVDRAQDLIMECLTKITSFRKEYKPDPSLLRISLDGFDATCVMGRTQLIIENKIAHMDISMSKYIMKVGLEDLFKNTFVHEYCHYLANLEMLHDTRVTFDHGLKFSSPEVEAYYCADDGHGECWLRYADELSKALQLKYKVTAHPQGPEAGLYKFANLNETVFAIECPNNDWEAVEVYEKDPANIFEYEPDLVRLIAATMMKQAECPHCDAELKLTFYQPEYRAIFTKYMVRRLRDLLIEAGLRNT